MKKLMSLLLVLAMVLGLVACGAPAAPAATEAPATEAAPAEMTAAEKAAAEAEIRYALGLLFDRNYIVEAIAQGGQVPASAYVPMGMIDADGNEFYKNAGTSDEFDGYYNVAPEALEANYAEAYEILCKYYEVDANGMFTNFPTLTYLYNTSDAHKAIGEYLQSALAGVGINMQMENQEWNTFLNTRKDGNFSIARNGWVADYTDPICFLDMWVSASGNNDIQYGKGAHADLAVYNLDLTDLGYDIKVENGTWAETYDVLISTIKSCTDNTTRFALMHKAEDMLMATGCVVPLYFYTDLYMLDDSVEGFFSIPLGYKYFSGTTVNGSGESISVCLSSEPDTLDPALNSATDGAMICQHLLAGLAKWAPAEDGSYTKIVAECAEELVDPVVNEDGTVTYTYTLKEGLKWSDGVALTAADFAFAWNRAASPELGADYGYMFDYVKRNEDGTLAVEAVDDRTLVVTLNNATPFWNELLAFTNFLPVREDVVADEGWATEAATYIGNGAYTLTSWEHDALMVFDKNENYHDFDNVNMKQIKMYLSDDDNNILTNWKNDTWRLVESFPTNEVPALKAEYPDEYIVAPSTGTYFLLFNMNEPLLP